MPLYTLKPPTAKVDTVEEKHLKISPESECSCHIQMVWTFSNIFPILKYLSNLN